MSKYQKVGKGNSYLGAFFAFSAFVVIAIIALAINMGPTNLKQEAASPSPTPPHPCSSVPKWTYKSATTRSTSITYYYSVKYSPCDKIIFSVIKIPSGWNYAFFPTTNGLNNCRANHSCTIYSSDKPSPLTLDIKISRPKTAKKGTYTIKLQALTGNYYSSKNLTYIVE